MSKIFDPHARILHDGQYEIVKSERVNVPIKNFSSMEDYEEQVKQNIANMKLEIEALEHKIQEKRRVSQEKSDKILEQVKEDAKKMMEEAEQNAFDRVQQSVQEKDQIIQKSIEEGDRIKLDAQRDAENIKSQANVEAEDIRRKAHQDGVKQGIDVGIEQGKSDLEFTIERLHNIIAETSRERERILVHSENQVINLVLSMVGKVVKKLGQEHKDVVVENTKAALALLRSAMTVFIHVSPHDFSYLSSFKKEFVNMMESRTDLKFIEDPTIDPGGVYIETDTGDVDATIRSQLEELENQMRFYMPVKVKSPESKRREQENTERLLREREVKNTAPEAPTPMSQSESYQQSEPVIIPTEINDLDDEVLNAEIVDTPDLNSDINNAIIDDEINMQSMLDAYNENILDEEISPKDEAEA